MAAYGANNAPERIMTARSPRTSAARGAIAKRQRTNLASLKYDRRPSASGGGDVLVLGVNTRATNAGGRNQEVYRNTPTLANVSVAVTRFPTSEAQLAHQRDTPSPASTTEIGLTCHARGKSTPHHRGEDREPHSPGACGMGFGFQQKDARAGGRTPWHKISTAAAGDVHVAIVARPHVHPNAAAVVSRLIVEHMGHAGARNGRFNVHLQ